MPWESSGWEGPDRALQGGGVREDRQRFPAWTPCSRWTLWIAVVGLQGCTFSREHPVEHAPARVRFFLIDLMMACDSPD